MTYSNLAYQRYYSPPTGKTYMPTMAEDWVICDVNQTFDDSAHPALQILHNEWFEFILYYLGEQWISFEKAAGTYRRVSKEDWIPTPVDNHVQTAVEVAHSNMLSSKLVPVVKPNSNLPDDRFASKVGELILRNLDGDLLSPWFTEKEWAYLWACIVGTGFLRPEVMYLRNKAIKLPVKTTRRSGALMDEEIDFGSEFETVANDVMIDTRHLNPFWVRVSELATDLHPARCPWWGFQEIKSLDWIRENFPDKADFVAADAIEGSSVRYQAKLAELVGSASTRVFSSTYGTRGTLYGRLDRHTIVKTKEWAPTLDYPRGRCAVVATNVLLYDGPLPISDDEGLAEYGGVAFHYRRVPGRFWSKGIVKDILSPQDRINGVDAQVVLNRKTCINPQKLIPAGSGITSWTGEPGLEVRWNPTQTMGHEPKIMPGVPLAPQIWNERVGMADAIKESSGSEDILKGKAPQGVRAGIALDMLEEKAASRHFHRDERMANALGQIYRLRLIMVQKEYKVPKLLKMVGEDNQWEVLQYTGAELRGNNDVAMEPDSGIARTSAGRTYLMMQLAQSGMVNVGNPIERAEIFRRLGMKNFRTEVSQDVERAHRENSMLSAGQGELFEEEAVFMLDDHHIHLAIHTDYMKQSNFPQLPPQVQEEFVSHVGAHIEAMMNSQAGAEPVEMPPGQEQQAQSGSQVAVGGGGASSI